MERLHPVLLAVPEEKKSLSGKDLVKFLSDHARKALGLSADLSGIRLGALEKDRNGVPLPSRGYFWSLSHKPLYAGGVVSKVPVGLDIEGLRKISPGIYKKTASDAEWALGKNSGVDLFFRYWTAKEAVIKANGTGLRDLLKCRVVEIRDDRTLSIAFKNKTWQVENRQFDGHTAAVACNGREINWTILKEENSCI